MSYRHEENKAEIDLSDDMEMSHHNAIEDLGSDDDDAGHNLA